MPDEMEPQPQSNVMSQFAPPQNPMQIQVSEDQEKTFVDIIKSDYDASIAARAKKEYGITAKGEKIDFEKWFKLVQDLYNSKRIPKDKPWKFCSNRSLRIATSILDMLHARLYPSVASEDLIKWRPGDITDVQKVERISKLMKWWGFVNSRIQDFLDIWVKMVCGYGDALVENCYKVDSFDSGETLEQPVTDEMGNPLTNPDGTPAILKSRKLRLEEKTVSRIYNRNQFFLQEGSRDIQKEPVIIEDQLFYRDLEDGEQNGEFVNISTALKEKIPVGKTEGLSEDEAERMRSIKIRNHPVKILRWYGHCDVDGDGYSESLRVTICPDYDLFIGGTLVSTLTKSGKRPLVFTKFSDRFDRPEENDGEGVLEKVRELSDEIDAIFNQLTDANSLSTFRPFFYDPSGDLDAPAMIIGPQKGIPVSDPARNVYFPELGTPVDQLIAAIKLVMEFIERLTAASSFVFGKEGQFAGGSGTATQTNAIMQSADIRFERPADRLRQGAAKIMSQYLDILQLNIPPGLETRILGEKGEPVFEANELVQEGITGQFDAYLMPDSSMGSKQAERELAGMMYSILLQNPLVGTDPIKIYKVTADLLKSWDKDPEYYLGPKPNDDDVDDPADENTLLVQGDFERVRANLSENHIYHMKVHQDLLNSPSLILLQEKSPNLVNEIMMAMQAHMMEHQMMLQTMIGMLQKFGSSGGGMGGTPSTGTDRSKGTPQPQGMEQSSGPLGQALNEKRAGESGFAEKVEQ